MGRKYIIELEDENYHQYSDSEPSDYLWKVKGFNALVFDEVGISKLTPYTEPDLKQIRKEAYEKGFHEGYGRYINKSYEDGLNGAWEVARKIANIPYGEEEKVIGSDGWTFIINHTASEAIEKIRQYEQEKDKQARIEYNYEEIKDVINTTMKECNVSLDDIASILQRMKEEA